ncbi:glycosyltransferase family 2 protein [Thermithiobacillus plumbiphilus]|uniref:Glycosyltransferase family 2 protein n=1 Tax=Thermithiobacillus plumbiphilus TaxID=1729899 RepID=A0ABU9DB76_9PROT
MSQQNAPVWRGLVLIPSYNSGTRLLDTVKSARAQWTPVWVVIDGSTDDSAERLARLASQDPDLRVLRRAINGGKGAAVRDGVQAALAAGFTHVLTMDADGQHPSEAIPEFMRLSRESPDALVLGVPQFGAEAPALRVAGRRLSNGMARLQTAGALQGDVLFGFRVYPAAALARAFTESPGMLGFDFDPEAVVRLVWKGHPVINRPALVRYFRPDEGGVSHFHYGRDNLRLIRMHTRLLLGGLLRRIFRR